MPFVNLPLVGATTGSIKINTDRIIEFRVIRFDGKFHVRAVVGIGTSYILNLPDAPYDTEAEAITAMDTFIATFTV